MATCNTYIRHFKNKGAGAQNASRNCFWDRNWGQRRSAIGLFVSLSIETVPEVFETINRPSFPLVSKLANGQERALR